MNKILIILKREYLTRVRKRSFIIMTILGPVLMGAIFIVPVWLAQKEDQNERIIAVIDDTNKIDNKYSESVQGIFYMKIPETQYVRFVYLPNTRLDSVRRSFSGSKYYGVLYIPSNVITINRVEFFSSNEPTIDVKMYIAEALSKEIQKQKLIAEKIDTEVLEKVKTNIGVNTFIWDETGAEKKSSTELAMGIGYISSFLIYMFIFLYGAQVMRGVIEEKTSRIVEIIISSVKPFQLMMGKVVGVALVGLTQFVLWILLTAGIVVMSQFVIQNKHTKPAEKAVVTTDIMSGSGTYKSQPENIDKSKVSELKEIFTWYDPQKIGKIIICFIFFFLGGYLLYGSLFAAVGSAVDGEADTQQFMMPITIPLILAIIVMISAIRTPDGPVAFWFSLIPFTSPILMMARIPFDPPMWQIILSAVLLIITFIGTTWLAGKVYRTGILMYGKKVSYAELWKWIKYKN